MSDKSIACHDCNDSGITGNASIGYNFCKCTTLDEQKRIMSAIRKEAKHLYDALLKVRQ